MKKQIVFQFVDFVQFLFSAAVFGVVCIPFFSYDSAIFAENAQNAENTESLPLLPSPPPVFKSAQAEKMKPEFRVDSFTYQPYGAKEIVRYELPYFQAGNKCAAVRLTDAGMNPTQDQSVFFHVDGKPIARIVWWGANKNGFGYPFKEVEGKPARLEIDRKNEVIRYIKPFLFEDGAEGAFQYELRRVSGDEAVQNPNLLELVWEITGPKASIDALPPNSGVSMWFISCSNAYRGKRLLFGDQEFQQAHRQQLMESKKNASFSGDFTYDADEPAHGFTLKLGDFRGGLEESAQISQTDERYSFIYRVQNSMKARIVIDFGTCLVPEKTLPAVNGHDFWSADALDAAMPPCRNLMRNPSFEQGLRYWRWTPGGAKFTPSDVPRYKIVPEGLFGRNALCFMGTQHSTPGLQCFPMGLEKGKTYTLSFYAKSDGPSSITAAPASGGNGGQFPWLKELSNPQNHYKTTTEWQRFSRTFVDDGAGLMLNVGTYGKVWLDGIQIEEGGSPTDFVSAPIEGTLETSSPDDDFAPEDVMDARLVCIGAPGTMGSVRVSVVNAFCETIYDKTFPVELKESADAEHAKFAEQSIPLDFDAVKSAFGQGVFCVQTTYTLDDGKTYNDFHRLAIMKKLANTHRTKNVFGNLSSIDRISRGDDLARKYMEWGFGSSSWGNSDSLNGELPRLMREYRIQNFFHSVSENGSPDVKKTLKEYKDWESVTPEMEALIEQNAFEQVSLNPPDLFPVWGFGNEEEGCRMVRNRQFDEYFKAQHAAAKGILRANPKAVVVPTCGTSGYSLLRGYDAIEGYLAASVRHNFRYGAVAVHPYWDLDGATMGGFDLDVEANRLREQMARYGYGAETPIFFTECFNVPGERFPNWGCDAWGDTWLYGKLSYDFGNRERIQAASVARLYIICLKYFPQLQHANIWRSEPFMDYYLTPYMLCKGVNTLGNLLGDVEYFADVKPFPNVRGYAFRLPDGRGIVPLWCIDSNVENGLETGPTLRVKLPKDTEFIDFMGNPRRAKTTDGVTEIPLTPAPLFLISKKPEALAKALQCAESSDAHGAVTIQTFPQKDGTISIELTNRTGSTQTGTLVFEKPENVQDDGKYRLKYTLAPGVSQLATIPDFVGDKTPCTLNRWAGTLVLEPENAGKTGVKQTFQLEHEFFFVPRFETSGQPDWDSIPRMTLTNRFKRSTQAGSPEVGTEGDLQVQYQMAWKDGNNEKDGEDGKDSDGKLYVRVYVTDDEVLSEPQRWEEPKCGEQLYTLDDCVCFHFDCGWNAKIKALSGQKGFDLDDYRYDVAPPKSSDSARAPIWRTREVNHQFADGLDMPTKEDASANIPVFFRKTKDGVRYTVVFGQRYLNPFLIREDSCAGFGLMVYDRDASKPENNIPGTRGLSNTSSPGLECENNPHLFPTMLLSE